jgi:cobalt-zinc-cadmium efflux system protein
MDGHGHISDDSISNFKWIFFINLAFTILEAIGGLYTNSLAIVSDALHDFGDSFTLGLSWYLEGRSRKGSDTRYSYGYRRFSLFSALANAIVLIAGSFYIFYEAIPRLIHPQPSNAEGMLILSVIGILVNGYAFYRFRRGQSLNVQMINWHLLGDLLGWIAVFIVSISLLFADIRILDPILSILINLYVLYNVVRNLRKTLALFMQAVPESIVLPELEQSLQEIPGVQSIHHTHIWSLDGTHNVLTAHLVVEACTEKEDLIRIKKEVEQITHGMDVEHTTVEIDYEDEDCYMNSQEKRERA